MKINRIHLIVIVSLLLATSIGVTGAHFVMGDHVKVAKVHADSSTKDTTTISKKAKVASGPIDDKDMRPFNQYTYKDSSELKDYPDLLKHPQAWIDISTQRVFIKDGTKTLYEMYASTGKNDTTPRGTYQVEPERGEYFYTQSLKLGAYYYVSFLNHGEYLFHTTPTDEQGQYVESIAKTLGVEPSSHGYIHLSNPDCKWIYDNVPEGMKIVIHGKFQNSKLKS